MGENEPGFQPLGPVHGNYVTRAIPPGNDTNTATTALARNQRLNFRGTCPLKKAKLYNKHDKYTDGIAVGDEVDLEQSR